MEYMGMNVGDECRGTEDKLTYIGRSILPPF